MPDFEGEFPVVDPLVVGRKNQEVLCIARSRSRSADVPGYDQLLMFDSDDGVTQTFSYGHDCLVEEHVFVPDPLNPSEQAEWIVGTSLNMQRRQTVVSLFHARAIADGPIATASLPYALPLGLHGCYVCEC